MWNGTLWVPQTVSGGGSSTVSAQAIGSAGRYYVFFDGQPSVGTTSITSNVLYLLIADIQKTNTIDAIAANVNTAGVAGTVARLGIYSSNSNSLPSTIQLKNYL